MYTYIYIHTYKAYANPALEEHAHAGGGAAEQKTQETRKPRSETADVAYFQFYKFRTSTDIN